MAGVKKIGNSYCVIHSTSKQPLVRGGKKVCYPTRGQAQADANRTKCRVMGVCPRK